MKNQIVNKKKKLKTQKSTLFEPVKIIESKKKNIISLERKKLIRKTKNLKLFPNGKK